MRFVADCVLMPSTHHVPPPGKSMTWWWLAWCSSLPLSGFIASLQPGPRAALQHCSLQSAAPCSHMPAPPAQGVMNSRTRTLLHFPAHYFPLFAYFPIHALIFHQQEQAAGWPLAVPADYDRFAVLYWLCIWIFPASIDHSPNMDHKLTTITAQ